MLAKELKPGIYWVGAKDWNVRDFHGYKTQRGTSYNAYLIVDKKIVLVDTVKDQFFDEMLARIKSVIDPSKINMVVSNHVEMDHSGGLPKIMNIAPKAKLITSPQGAKGLRLHYDTLKWNMEEKKSGDTIKIGDKTLQFICTPMLHWPDSMMTYLPEEKLLLPNDAFGQHLALNHLFDDEGKTEVILDEAAKYYANIVYPFGTQVKKALQAVSELDIEMIAPSHGLIWRDKIPQIVKKYSQWADNYNDGSALIIYDSMWGSTEKMAHALKEGFIEQNVPVIVRSLKHSHISDLLNDMLEAKYIAIGSPTLNNQVLPTVAALLSYMKGLKPQNKIGFAFGSYGWNSKIVTHIENVMNDLKWTIPEPAMNINYLPTVSKLRELNKLVNQIIE